MKNNISISDSEWQIMQALWETPNMTLKEIARRVEGAGWSYTTVRTLVNRLADKGVIGADKSVSNNFKYYPVAVEGDCKKKEVKNLLDRVFNGSAGMLISMLTKDSNLSEQEQRELEAIISKIDK